MLTRHLLPALTPNRLIMLFAAVLVAFYNFPAWGALASLAELTGLKRVLFEVSFAVFLWAAFCLLLLPFSFRPLLRPVISLVAVTGALAAYFMNAYGVAIDRVMMQNVMETNPGEVSALLSGKMVVYLLLGLVPATLAWLWPVRYQPFLHGLLTKLALAFSATLLLVLAVVSFYSTYAPLFREEDKLTHFINPTAYIYATAKVASEKLAIKRDTVIQPIGTDAKRVAQGQRKKLMIFVVGETARADHFALNGYPRPTNPELSQLDVLNFTQVHSCGTSTAVSVPCMFSMFPRKGYTDKKGKTYESLLDVLQRTGMKVLWLENNSDCKGVCRRVPNRDIPKTQPSPFCDGQRCLDEALLVGLEQYIDTLDEDTIIVLHSDGSHGPEYYDRYPPDQQVFAPVCHTNQLGSCSQQELVNVYDNTIHYTDHFLAQVVDLLKHNQQRLDTAMWYVSDHGESLGEKGVYLHAAPYSIAPEAQTHVPMVLWFGQGALADTGIDRGCLQAKENQADLSHDYVFHSLLGWFNVNTNLYQGGLDLFRTCRKGS
ncbi:phosphoethanolamine transferase [Pseudomonas typographi]|uniref:Phosphoethanolamine--lipid A transferase n=1 Tax=Pseudomonas typographi TaxID=2715964 RepID=A0ABR7Z6S8_9PSED|nr:phosphoethanolamine--lipid A transferase [Pseudomonas typographi]MBD1553522.1 phosphoethanolamine--lipid A transferase [Pseudomonas typographi]MBD1588941.1 phosphoethanolamine--lipid A transferase [Pseudomonas typographi]MBD1600996.1 phosphoethanolamine--lipid A transferase [Pseudomonas typographi]